MGACGLAADIPSVLGNESLRISFSDCRLAGVGARFDVFDLVYHGCVVSYWYWGDYNNKLPALWSKRDLFNALYGEPPMYVVTPDNWPQFRERVFASCRVAASSSRLTAMAEMTDHRILTADRTVQQTVFDSGVRVTVNFGAKDCVMSDGFLLKVGLSRIDGAKKVPHAIRAAESASRQVHATY